MMLFVFRNAAAAALLLGFCVSAWAYPVRWTLDNVVFDDGGTASGYYIYDASLDHLGAFSISVSGGDETTFPPFTYDTSSASGSVNAAGGGDYGLILSQNGSQRGIRLPAVSALTDAGGTLAVNIAGAGASECYNCGPARTYASGNVVGVPVPRPPPPPQATTIPVLDGLGIGLLVLLLVTLALRDRSR